MIWFYLLVITLYNIRVEAKLHRNVSDLPSNHSLFRNEAFYFHRDLTKTSYYLHVEKETWFTAREKCQSEDGELAVVQNKEEAKYIAAILKSAHKKIAFIELHALMGSRNFTTVQGVPIYAGYDEWDVNQPDNHGGNEKCAEIRANGKLNDWQCERPRPFICKNKDEDYDQSCNKPYRNYRWNVKVKRCYKFHSKLLDWESAYKVCKSEESHLAVIYDKPIAEVFADMVKSRGKNHQRTSHVWLGFHNLFEAGYETVLGEPLTSLEYNEWSGTRPHHKCGGMNYRGKLDDMMCDQKHMFICEKGNTVGSGDLPHKEIDDNEPLPF